MMFVFTELPQKVNMKAFSLDKLPTYTVEELKLGKAIHPSLRRVFYDACLSSLSFLDAAGLLFQ